MSQELQTVVDAAWEKRDGISSTTKGPVRDAVEAAIAGLDDGTYRTAEKFGNEWVVNQWLKKAVLLSFRLYDSVPMDGGASFPGMGGAPWFDKVPLKTTGWDAARFAKAGFRAVPGSIVRRGSYVAPSVVVMPAFINLGAYVDTGTMVDTWA
ncbi:MAG TPA: 2,3,4,5-tetrahydropyridine-2,6-dicarboxylate N-succinyltransferase, partial [Reyranella sp.]